MKLDAKRDLLVAFGDYVLATTAETNNSMAPRAEPFIALRGKGNPTGIVWMLNLKTNKVVTRDQCVHLPMPDIVIEKPTRQALRQRYTRGEDPSLEFPAVLDEDDDDKFLPGMMDIDGRADELSLARPQNTIGSEDLEPLAGVSAPVIVRDTGSPIVSEPHTD
jgi:hypothetical protein